MIRPIPHRTMLTVAMMTLAVFLGAACEQQQDPNKVRREVSVVANKFIEAMNGKKLDVAKGLLHKDAPEDWQQDFESSPLLKGFRENKYQQIKAEKTEVNLFLDRHEVPLFLYSISFIEGKVMQKKQVGTMTLVWTSAPEHPDKYLLIDIKD